MGAIGRPELSKNAQRRRQMLPPPQEPLAKNRRFQIGIVLLVALLTLAIWSPWN